MKKQIYLFSRLVFLFVQIAFGQENNDTSDQATTTRFEAAHRAFTLPRRLM